MEIFGISSLTRDVKQNNLYDLFIKTYEDNTDVPFGQYTVKVEDTMRIDLVCQKIYNTTEHIYFNFFNFFNKPMKRYPDIS